MVKKLSVSEKFLSGLRVKVTKNESDSRNSLCGEPMQIDEDGNEYFIIPAHQAEYQSKIHPHYNYSEEFSPDGNAVERVVPEKSLSEKYPDRAKVKVTKRTSDDVKRICGEEMRIDDTGHEYFEVPAHQAGNVKAVFPDYIISSEYLFGEKPEVVENIKKPRGNPNWRHKHKLAEKTEDGEGNSDAG